MNLIIIRIISSTDVRLCDALYINSYKQVNSLFHAARRVKQFNDLHLFGKEAIYWVQSLLSLTDITWDVFIPIVATFNLFFFWVGKPYFYINFETFVLDETNTFWNMFQTCFCVWNPFLTVSHTLLQIAEEVLKVNERRKWFNTTISHVLCIYTIITHIW